MRWRRRSWPVSSYRGWARRRGRRRAMRTTAPFRGHDNGRDDKLLFFASDGLRQDAVEQYARQGVVPGFRDLLRNGARASGNGLLTQAPPEHGRRLVHADHGRLAGRPRLDQQHLPRQRPAVRQLARARIRRPACCRPRRSPSPPSAAARRSPRSSGPAGAVAPSTARRSTSATSARAAAWPRTTSPLPTRRLSPRSFGLQFDHPAGFAGNAPFPQAAPSPASGWTDVPRVYSPAQEMRLRVLDGDRRQVRPQRLHLRQPQRRPHALRPRPVLDDQGRRRLGRRPT